MKKLILILFMLTLGTLLLQAQEKFELKADYDYPEDRKIMELNDFQGIEKMEFTLNNPENLIGKNFKLIIREYQNGKLATEKVVLDTEKEGLPKIDSTFQFTLFAQNIINRERIGFYFPRFLNKQTFETKKEFRDGDFRLRKINIETESLAFELKKQFQIALITPPNKNPSKGNLGYCQVSQGGIDIESWYEKYEIPQFFLIYMEIW